MPHIGQKRRNSIEATCDSSQCAFCSQRSQFDLAHASCTSDSHASTGASLSSDFSSWLEGQKTSDTAQGHIDLGKIGLPSSQVLAGPPSKRNRTSIEICEASSSDSSDPSPTTFGTAEESSSVLSMPAVKTQAPGVPWAWSNEWADQPQPRPGTLAEVCSFSAPFSRGHSIQHTADIVCGVEFSPDGNFFATAGVAKQVFASTYHIAHIVSRCGAFFGTAPAYSISSIACISITSTSILQISLHCFSSTFLLKYSAWNVLCRFVYILWQGNCTALIQLTQRSQ